MTVSEQRSEAPAADRALRSSTTLSYVWFSALPVHASTGATPVGSLAVVSVPGSPIAAGLSSKDVARKVWLSPTTLKAHVAGLIAVVGGTDRIGAATATATWDFF